MSIMTLVLGQSGTGKSTSMRNMAPEKTALIKVIDKPLPFRSAGWKAYTSDRYDKIISAARKAAMNGKEVIVIDDFQYLLANEFMRRSDEKGFDKFTEIARHAWDVINVLSRIDHSEEVRQSVRVYIMCHTDEVDGRIKMKTVGKMLDEKITPEGMFTIVLRTSVQDGKYLFSTNNNGADTVKTPMGMFSDDYISNDLNEVDSSIREYYGIGATETV